ncbi:MAG: permease [Candidatus Omnitrophica bacterium]|nr:permease [Candidatus Omnitrophota bacterium]
MENFFQILLHYTYEVIPALAVGFLISGFVHELIPEDKVLKYLGTGGLKPILYATIIGTFLPVCCWGSLPIAVSFYKKGAKLGPVLAFLVATPATSISALLVAYSVLGLGFTVYIFFAVIIMGVSIGLLGNIIKYTPKPIEKIACPHCELDPKHELLHREKTTKEKLIDALKYAFIDLPKEIGLELLIGLILAAFVATYMPLGHLIKAYLSGWFGYVFSVVFGLLMYICSTASVPLIDSLMKQGMNAGSAMTLLLMGPVASYGTIFVLRKEYGMKVLLVFLTGLIISSLLLGIGFQLLRY